MEANLRFACPSNEREAPLFPPPFASLSSRIAAVPVRGRASESFGPSRNPSHSDPMAALSLRFPHRPASRPLLRRPPPRPSAALPPSAVASRRFRDAAQAFFPSTQHSRFFVFCSGSATARASTSGIPPSDPEDAGELLRSGGSGENGRGVSFLAKLGISLGIAVTATVLSYVYKSPASGTSVEFAVVVGGPLQPASPGFAFKLFGHQVLLPESTPGWVYFWLLMAAGCGLFISEEALNVWVGITLARKLSLDGTWRSFAQSFSNNASYIISTVLWVYWGVCISDMVPFYLGKLFRQTKASEDICAKLGIGKDKVVSITRAVQRYGNLIGFVERFSIGVRNPTSFLAGAWGISADCFFAGVCLGGIFTLIIQLGIGVLLRDHPLMALASVATFVGIWTTFPYLLAASTALFLYVRQGKN